MYNSNMEEEPSAVMPISQHLEDLRKVLLRAIIGLIVGVAAGAFFVKPVLNFFAQSIGGVDKLQVIEVTESMSVYMRVALLIGLIVALPWIFYQLFSFVGKGLKKAEKRGLLIAIPFATLLFLAGGSFAFFIMLPSALPILTQFLGITTTIRVKSYIDFIINLMFWIGISFELPLIVFILARLGIVNAKSLLNGWRYALIAMAILAALITPTVDPINMAIFMLPLFLLYLLSILLAKLAQNKS